MNETSTRKIWEILKSEYLTKSFENHLYLKRRLYRFQLKKRISISEHMNIYMKFLTNLANMDKVIKDEDKALILLSFLLNEEYENFSLTLINDKQSLCYSDVSTALVNHEVRRKDKESSFSSVTAEALTARGTGFSHRKGKGDFGKFKTSDREYLKKYQCALCREEEHGRLIA